MRHIAIASLLLSASLSAQASVLNHDADRLEVNVPNLKGGFDFGVTLTYLETNYHNTELVIVDTSTDNLNNPYGRTKGMKLTNKYGYSAYAGWKFQDTGNDIRLTYFRFEGEGSGHKQVEGLETLWKAVGNVDDVDFIHRVDKAEGDLSNYLTTFDVEGGQHLNIGSRGHLRLLAGVSYAKIDKDLKVGYLGYGGTDGNKSEKVNLASDFDGIGPKAGCDFDFALGGGFGVATHASTALLFGTMQSKTQIDLTVVDGDAQKLKVQDDKRCVVVPNLDLRLGLDYTSCLCNHGKIRVEGGYWVKHYFSSVNEIHMISGRDNANYVNNINDASFHGLYLTLSASM